MGTESASECGERDPSLRLFALGLRANKCRLMEPCCLGGSPFSFIDQARSVLLFVLLLTICRFLLSAARRDISFCFLIFLFSFASPCGGVLLLLVSRVSFLLSSHFLASVLVSCLRCVHRWSVRSSSRVAFSASAVSVVWFVFGVAGIQYALTILFLGGQSSSPRGHPRTASSVWRAAHCTVHRGQPPLRRHQPVSTLVEGFGLCCRGSRLIYQQVSLSPPGGTPERSAPFQKCGLALLSRLTILASMVVPSFSSCRVSPPRGVDQCLVRRKNPVQNFL